MHSLRPYLQRSWPFALLIVLSATRWIAADQWPATGSTLRSEAVAALLCALALVPKATLDWPANLRAALAGAALLAAPALGAALHGTAAQPFNRTSALCFVPFFAAVFGDSSGRRLGAPLAGIAGALLLFPLALPVTLAAWTGLLIPPLAVGAACGLLLHRPFAAGRATAFFAGGAVGLGAIEMLRMRLTHEPAQPLTAAAVVLDVVIALCVLLSLLRLSATSYTSRYYLAPVLTVFEGMVIFRPNFDARVWLGVLLLLGAAVALLRQTEREPRPSLLDLR